MSLVQSALYWQVKPGPLTLTLLNCISSLRRSLPQPLVSTFQYILDANYYLPSGYQVHIKLIPKNQKNPMEPGSYHTISLLKLDSKLLSIITANWLVQIMPSLIHPSQAGFTQGQSATSNIRIVMELESERATPPVNTSFLLLMLKRLLIM